MDTPTSTWKSQIKKNALSTFQRAGFKPKEMVKVYHLGIRKLLPIAPAYILILKRASSSSHTTTKEACEHENINNIASKHARALLNHGAWRALKKVACA